MMSDSRPSGSERRVSKRLDPTQQSQVVTDFLAFAKSKIVGQDEILIAIAKALQKVSDGKKVSPLYRHDRRRKRPLLVICIPGPPGVGKTAIAQMLAEYLYGDSRGMLRLDGQTFREDHSVTRIVGVPPGYEGYHEPPITQKEIDKPAFQAYQRMRGQGVRAVGFEDEERLERLEEELATWNDPAFARSDTIYQTYAVTKGQITRLRKKLKKKGNRTSFKYGFTSVVLVDEIERGNESFRNILYRILGEGIIETTCGKSLSFLGSFVIITSNLGTEELEKYLRQSMGVDQGMGFGSAVREDDVTKLKKECDRIVKKSLGQFFQSSFRRRFTTIPAYPLSRDNLTRLFTMTVKDNHQIPVTLRIDKRVEERFIERAYRDVERGGDGLCQDIILYILDPVDALLKTGQIHKGDIIDVSLDTPDDKKDRSLALMFDKQEPNPTI